MSTTLIRNNGLPCHRNHRVFLIEHEDELKNLPTSTKFGKLEDPIANQPCAVGSIAVISHNTFVYFLSPSDEWTFDLNGKFMP